MRAAVSRPDLGRVRDHHEDVHALGGPPGEVLHARLVVDDHVGILVDRLVDEGAQHVVDVAIAARAFGAAHGQQVELLPFGLGELQLRNGPSRACYREEARPRS